MINLGEFSVISHMAFTHGYEEANTMLESWDGRSTLPEPDDVYYRVVETGVFDGGDDSGRTIANTVFSKAFKAGVMYAHSLAIELFLLSSDYEFMTGEQKEKVLHLLLNKRCN